MRVRMRTRTRMPRRVEAFATTRRAKSTESSQSQRVWCRGCRAASAGGWRKRGVRAVAEWRGDEYEERELRDAKELLLPESNSGRDIGFWLFQLLFTGHRHTWRLLPAFLLTFGGKFAGIQSAILFKRAVDGVIQEGSGSSITAAGGLKVAVAILLASGLLKALKSLASEARHVIFAPLSQELSRFLALKVFAHLFSLDSTFHVSRQTGGVINIVERGIRAILTFFRTSVLTLIPTLVEWTLVCGYVANQFSLQLASILVLTFVGYFCWTVHWTQVAAKQRKESIEKDIQVSAKLADTLLNYEQVVLTGNEGTELSSYNKLLRQYQHFSLLNVYSSATMNAGQGAIIAMGITSSLVLTVLGCFQGTMSVGDIVLVQALLLQLLEPLQFLGWYYSSLKNCFVDLEAMLEILMTSSNLKDGSVALAPPSSSSIASRSGLSIEMRNAEYSYQEDRKILRGVDLRVNPGESVAVVGASGSGKSTLLRMILRLYDVDSGDVLVDGTPIQSYQLSTLRSSMALIPQDTLMFNDTIYNNVAYGDQGASRDEVLAAMKGAQLDKLISSLPLGAQTVVGERGIKLSGGERQRIAIARAILRQPRLLVCDEATSSLDSATEAEIMTTLQSVAKGRTCLFISHRLSTVQHCDRIYVLSEGKIVETGSHEELLSDPGTMYNKMWRVQEKKLKEEEMTAISK
ncbi:ABC transporter [Chloropicon primus]|uniref:ABC transporter n=2 Tax=Chloropicon primus TaxID=1764295 RepID=A0A5B8MRT4_9CHLO|nr:ABC transporter [Chloropicon primus]|eukprot:QDZ23186.1 ABC transporter [Chloropicon primus]